MAMMSWRAVAGPMRLHTGQRCKKFEPSEPCELRKSSSSIVFRSPWTAADRAVSARIGSPGTNWCRQQRWRLEPSAVASFGARPSNEDGDCVCAVGTATRGRRGWPAVASVAGTAAAETEAELEDEEGEEDDEELRPLEPFFYYMGKKRGVKAYGVEFKEALAMGPTRAQVAAAVAADAAAGDGGGVGLAGFAAPWTGQQWCEGLKGVGVYAARDIDTTDGAKIVLEIPLPLMLTVSRDPPWMFYPNIVPMGHPMFDAIQSTHAEHDWDLRLACLLLLALGGNSSAGSNAAPAGISAVGDARPTHFFAEYCDFMPPMDDCPSLLMASEEELGQLQDEQLQEEVKRRQQRVVDFWEQHWGELAETPRILKKLVPSQRHLMWAVSQASYRGVLHNAPMGIVNQDGHMLIPYADMLNHSHAPNCYLYWRQIDRVMEVRVMPDQLIKAGEELTLCYAPKQSNRELMLSHGFSMAQNQWESVTLPEGTPSLHRDSFLSAFDIVGDRDEFAFSTGSPGFSPDAQAFLGEAIIAAARCLPTWHDGDVPSVPSEEISAARGIQAECIRILQQFPTSLEEDLRIMTAEAEQRTAAWLLAVKYRIDRKVFLTKLIHSLDVYLERLLI